MFTATAIVAAMLMTGAEAPPAERTAQPTQETALSSDSLASGNAATAITSLERSVEAEPNDPALLINLGIAYAHSGKADSARDMFERALVSSEPIELETADGTATDSRRVARRAMRMLERGEFTPAFSRRD